MSDAEVAYPAADSVCSYEGDCDRPAWRSCPEGKCLYHSPANGNSPETARLVWQTARRMAADKDAEKCDFTGWHFPDDPDGDIDFESWHLVGWFVGFCFEKPVSFKGVTFSGNAWFYDATFGDDVWFSGAMFSGTVWFDGVAFSGHPWFNGATFGGDAWFMHATFNSNADFDGATFRGIAEFGGTTFRGIAGFEGATFGGNAGFEGTTFDREAWFDGARFQRGVDIFFDKPRRGRPFCLRREGETAYRLAKQAAQERGDYAAAGDYHYAEQCAIEDKYRRTFGCDVLEGRPWHKALWGWCISSGRLLFGRMVYGYGERPMRPLFIALAVIVLWTGFYCHWDAIVPSDPGLEPAARAAYEPNIGECLYCSIVTFTTLGYGDYQPKAPYRLLAASEALLGAALMAVFIVCLSKKYIR